MMALVAYDNSDGSDYENDDDETTVVVPATTLNNALQGLPPKESNIIEQKEADDQNLFNLLPKPVNQKTLVKEEDDEFLHKKESISDVKPKSRITVPSLEDFKDVKDTVPSVRPKVSNGKKSGLLSLLPQPKNGANITTKMLIPHSVTNKPQTATVKKKNPLPSPMKKTIVEAKSTLIADYSDDSDDDIQNDFFSIHKQVELPPADAPLDIDVKNDIQSTSKKEPRSLESYFKKDVHVELEPDYIEPEDDVANHSDVSQNEVEETKNNDIVLDEEAILKLCGSRGKRKREEIQIVDVNQQEVLKDAREMLLRGLMDDTTKRQSHSKKRGNEPTSQQKRKHQITYLAHQAKANEAELQNQWANNRMTKRQTQSKYGF